MSASPSSTHKYAALVQVLSKLCKVNNACDPAQLNDALRERDPSFFTRSGQLRFKSLVIKAQEEGAPVEWIDGVVPAVKFTSNARRAVLGAPKHPGLGTSHASLIQVLSKLCDQAGFTNAAQAAVELRRHDPVYHQTFAVSGFKELILQAQRHGAPVVWVPEGKRPAAVQLTLDKATRARLHIPSTGQVTAVPTTSIQKNASAASVRTAKRAATRARAAERAGATPLSRDESVPPATEVATLEFQATTLDELDVQIQAFLRTAGQTVLLLSPMDKPARELVYGLASAYALLYKTSGTGGRRVTVLTKVARSGKRIKEQRIRDILSASGARSLLSAASATVKKAASTPTSGVRWNKEGAQVGFEAAKIPEDNAGYKVSLRAVLWPVYDQH